MYACVYVCMNDVCMYVYTYVRTYVCLTVCLSVCLYVCMYICLCMYSRKKNEKKKKLNIDKKTNKCYRIVFTESNHRKYSHVSDRMVMQKALKKTRPIRKKAHLVNN